jgi:hypothetical protein
MMFFVGSRGVYSEIVAQGTILFCAVVCVCVFLLFGRVCLQKATDHGARRFQFNCFNVQNFPDVGT